MGATISRLLGCGGIVLSLALAGCCNNPGPATKHADPCSSPSNREVHAPPESDKNPQVARVIDGDTFELEDEDRVRLICVNTPERGQPGYNEAKAFLRDLVEGKTVRLEHDPDMKRRDSFGRRLCYVWLDDELVNAAVIRAGHSEYATKWGASSVYEAELLTASAR
jgi:micrococcal nuclease